MLALDLSTVFELHSALKDYHNFFSELNSDGNSSSNFKKIEYCVDFSEIHAATFPFMRGNERGYINRIIFEESGFSFALLPGTIVELFDFLRMNIPMTSDSIQYKLSKLNECVSDLVEKDNLKKFEAAFTKNLSKFYNGLGLILDDLTKNRQFTTSYIVRLLKKGIIGTFRFIDDFKLENLKFNYNKMKYFSNFLESNRPDKEIPNVRDVINYGVIEAINSSTEYHLVLFSKSTKFIEANKATRREYSDGIDIRGIRYFKCASVIIDQCGGLDKLDVSYIDKALGCINYLILKLEEVLTLNKNNQSYVENYVRKNKRKTIEFSGEFEAKLVEFKTNYYDLFFSPDVKHNVLKNQAKNLFNSLKSDKDLIDNYVKKMPEWSKTKRTIEKKLNSLSKKYESNTTIDLSNIIDKISDKVKMCNVSNSSNNEDKKKEK